MAIVLITGLPGHGKGVFSLDTINKLEQETGRPVYYHNVKDLALKWHLLDDPKQWFNLPEGSIILLDEAWQTFPIRPNAQIPPDYVAQLATHRHKGYDIYIVTQQPSQLDTFVRKLIDKHYHVVRKFGDESANVHEFIGLNPNPQLTRKNSIKHSYKYPKHIYEWYKSAEVHTVKTKRPMRIYFLWFGVPLLLIASIYFINELLNPKTGAVSETLNQSFQSAKPAETPDSSNYYKGGSPQQPELTYIEAHTPELKDFPHTAPVYKEITQAVHAPVPAACVVFRGTCTCYTQQATKLFTTDSTCRQIVKGGFFNEFQSNPEQSARELQVSPIGVSGQSPDVDKPAYNIIDSGSRGSPDNSPA